VKKKPRKSSNLLLSILEKLGKPVYFLFTFTIISLITSLELFSIIAQKIKRLSRPKKQKRKSKNLHKFTLPSLQTTLLFLSPFIVTFVISILLYQYIFKDLPSPRSLTTHESSLSTKILSRDGDLLYKIYGTENRTLVKLSELPPSLIGATVAAEDQNFYHHFGLDLSGIMRALVSNFECRLSTDPCLSPLQGGSTITQQLIKNTIGESDKTLRRKLREAVLALWTERLYSKSQILELYLNNIPYGGTSYGVEEAAQELFGKSAKNLNLAESALIAGLPVAPTPLSPYGTTPYLAKVRQGQILEQMVAEGFITENDKVKAEQETLVFNPKRVAINAPHFVMYVKALLVEAYGEELVERGGLVATTTLSSDKQRLLEDSITKELSKLSNLHVQNGAGMIVDPGSGEILAMAGSANFWDSEKDGQVNITLSPRQPGSSIKPITYTLALLSGLSPRSVIDDSPVCFSDGSQASYCPKNYDGRFHGKVTLRTALASSYNVPAVKLLNSLGVKNLVELGQKMGITTWTNPSLYGLSLTLGAGEVKMIDLVQAYSVFANGGLKVPLKAILEVKDAKGNLLSMPCNTCDKGSVKAAPDTRVIPAEVAYQISSILADPLARAPAFGTHSVLNIKGHTVSVKTGTTNNLRDNWTIGYAKDFLTATWVGNNDNSPMSSVASGITGASPIWANVMSSLLKDSPDSPPAPPSTLKRVPLCPADLTYYCQDLCTSPPVYEYFTRDKAPKKDCSPKGVIE